MFLDCIGQYNTARQPLCSAMRWISPSTFLLMFTQDQNKGSLDCLIVGFVQ